MKSLRFFSLLVLLASTVSVQADMLYEESFSSMRFPLFEDGLRNYGGYGANPNPVGADGDLLTDSLTYVDSAGNALATSGKHALLDAHKELGTVSNVHTLPSPWNVPGNTIWVSFVGRQTEGSTARFFNLGLRSSSANPTEIVTIGMPSNATNPNAPDPNAPAKFWRIYDRSGITPTNFAITAVSTNTQVFALARMEANVDGTDLERYTLWLNPRLDQAPVEAAGFTFTSIVSDIANWSAITEIRLAAGGPPTLPASAWEVDEVRIATTWQEVTPYLTMTVTDHHVAANGASTISWTAAPGAQDTVQWSADLVNWEPYLSSTRINPAGAETATWTTPPTLLQKLYLRVARTAPAGN